MPRRRGQDSTRTCHCRAGVLIISGLTNNQVFGLLYAAGAGFYFSTGAGVGGCMGQADRQVTHAQP